MNNTNTNMSACLIYFLRLPFLPSSLFPYPPMSRSLPIYSSILWAYRYRRWPPADPRTRRCFA